MKTVLELNNLISRLSPKFKIPKDNSHIKWLLTYRLAESLMDESVKGLARFLMDYKPLTDDDLDSQIEMEFGDYTEEDVEAELVEFGYTKNYKG